MDVPRIFSQDVEPYNIDTSSAICLGGILHNNQVFKEHLLNISLKNLNRHGLIAGATGTGKTKTIQVLGEQLSSNGIPVLMMDIKGDLSGLAYPGVTNEKILIRQQSLNLPFNPTSFPVNFMALEEHAGIQVRTTLQEIGPLLFSKMIDLNETQTGIIQILFQYAEDNDLLLLDLDDIKQLINYALNEGRNEFDENYGGTSTQSLKLVFRRILQLISQGGDKLFGEPSLDINDLFKLSSDGKGVISILRLMNMQETPNLFSTFMLALLAKIDSNLVEIGDPDKPKFMLFIDEAHLIFNNATPALLKKIESIIKLIRSKGVGIIFCTQSPDDIPSNVLGQIGLKIQHALRAFTAKDRKAIKLISENFPLSDFYDTSSLITSLGIGESLVTALNDNGQPTPLVTCRVRAAESRMGPLTEEEFNQYLKTAPLVKKYEQRLERTSAMEVLKQRVSHKPQISTYVKKEKMSKHSTIETLSKNTLFRQVIRNIAKEVTKALLNLFGLNKSKRR